jgi:hypothetical protein
VTVRLNEKTSKERVRVGKCGPLMVRRKGKVELESSELYSVRSRGHTLIPSQASPISAQFVPKRITPLRARKVGLFVPRNGFQSTIRDEMMPVILLTSKSNICFVPPARVNCR